MTDLTESMTKSSLQSKPTAALAFLDLLIYCQLADKSSTENCDILL